MATDVWEQVYDRIAGLAAAHRTTLVFVNTRRTAERMARHLADRLGKEAIAAHHGSLAKEHRFDAEQRLKRGELKLLVATASLELGIDIGDVDLVCQVGSPRGIAPFLQRVGRSGHHVGGVPKGRLFPLSRDEPSNARRCSIACSAASSTRCAFPKRRSTCSRSRSSPKWHARSGRRTRCMRVLRARRRMRG